MVRFNKFLPAAFAVALALAPFAATARANDVPSLQAMHVAVNSQGRPAQNQLAENSKGRPAQNQLAENSKGRPAQNAPANQDEVG